MTCAGDDVISVAGDSGAGSAVGGRMWAAILRLRFRGWSRRVRWDPALLQPFLRGCMPLFRENSGPATSLGDINQLVAVLSKAGERS